MGLSFCSRVQRGLTLVLVGGLMAFGLWGNARWDRAGAAESAPAPEFLNADPDSAAPYSDAVRVGSTLYLAGQLGLDENGKLVAGGITPESERTMENLKQTLERNGSSLDGVVSCLLFLADINERADFNAVYQKYFQKGRFPARTAVGTTGLYAGARVEISCTAVVK
jgi:2-iminobutanoate/2-iminopropanoate deaminase